MSTSSYLATISNIKIWEKYAEGALAIRLGLADDFNVHYPLETESYLKDIATSLSTVVKNSGQKLGEKKYKDFRPDKTRFSPSEIDDLWQNVRSELQTMLNDEYKNENENPFVPGIDKLGIRHLIPKSAAAMDIIANVDNNQQLIDELNKVKEGVTRMRFLETLRTIVWKHWEKEFDLYKEGKKIDEGATNK